MTLWDAHMHTSFSGDSETPPEQMIERAIALGLPGITITDHLDLDYYPEPGLFDLDFASYTKKIPELAGKYKALIPVRFGIEIGLQPHLAETHREIAEKYPFDFIIGSSHMAHGKDPYYPDYFEGRTEEDGYREYFTSILENIDAWHGFDVYGHIDYVVRYGPNQNRNYSYEKYADVIDEILKKLISLGKGIEINTSGFKYGLGHPNPTEAIIRRYHELGGEIITIGADAHQPEHIAYDFEKVSGILKEAGFDHYNVFRQRKPEEIMLE